MPATRWSWPLATTSKAPTSSCSSTSPLVSDNRDTTVEMVRRVADEVYIPFTVGGGIRTLEDARRMLRAGADKVSVEHRGGRAAGAHLRDRRRVRRPVCRVCDRRRAQRRRLGGLPPRWSDTDGHRCGRVGAGGGAAWCRRDPPSTSMDRDGTREGFESRPDAGDRRCRHGAGDRERWRRLDRAPGRGRGHRPADAVLAASIFHFREHTVADAKAEMSAAGIHVRPV